MPFTNYLDNALGQYQFGNVTYYPTTQQMIGLSTTTPTQTGSNFTEPSGGGYGRPSFANAGGASIWTYSTPSTGGIQVTNNITLYFPTATSSWGTITYWGIFDYPGTHLLAYGPLTTPQLISGGTPAFPAGSLILVLD